MREKERENERGRKRDRGREEINSAKLVVK